jgi:uncharacterized membrane protein YdjX (TVP38/TMEM64 family)
MIDEIIQWIGRGSDLTLAAVLVLALANIVTQLVPVPRFLPGFVAGAAYGLNTIPIVVIGTTLGAMAAFLLSRHLAAAAARRLIQRGPVVERIAEAVAVEGWRIVAISRLGLPVPSSVVNYLFGITTIGWWPFAWATFLFCIPLAVLFVGLGAAGHVALAHDSDSDLNNALLVVGIVSSAAVIYFVSRRARASFQTPV